MEFKEVVLEAWSPGKRKLKKMKETWYTVMLGDKEFLMPEKLKNHFAGKIYHESQFSLYFDGDKIFTDDKYHIPEKSKDIKYRDFIVLHEKTELFEPENLTLLGKIECYNLYMIKNGNGLLAYKFDKTYRVINYPSLIVTFETEKPVNEEMYNLLKRLRYYDDKAKYIKIDGIREFTNIRILDDKDVKVYTVEDTDKHRIVVIDNAELVRSVDEYIAIKGNKTYIVMNHRFYVPISSNILSIEKVKGEYKNKHRMYEYIIPNTIKTLKQKVDTDYYEGNLLVGYRKISSNERSIVEIPSLDTEIIARKWIRKAEPVLEGIEYKLDKYKEYTYKDTYVTKTGEIKEDITKVSIPIALDCKMLKPELVEEKTYKIKDFLNKPVELGY